PPPALVLEEEDEAQAAGLVQSEHVLVPVVLAALLAKQLEAAFAHLVVGGSAVLVLDAGEGGGVEDDEAQAAALGELAGKPFELLVIGGDGLTHLEAPPGCPVAWKIASIFPNSSCNENGLQM